MALPRAWGNIGVGIGKADGASDNPVLAFGMSLTYRYRRLGFSGRWTESGTTVREFAFLAGPVVPLGRAVVHVAAGVSRITDPPDWFSVDRSSSPEIGTALGVIVFPSSYPRLGLHGFANFNPTSDVVGLLFVFQYAK